MRWSADGNAYRNSAQPHRGERVREGILPPRIIGPEPPRFLKMRYRLGSLSEIGKDIYPMKVRSDNVGLKCRARLEIEDGLGIASRKGVEIRQCTVNRDLTRRVWLA